MALFSIFGFPYLVIVFFFQAEDGIRDLIVTGVQTCALTISWSHTQGMRLLCYTSAYPGVGNEQSHSLCMAPRAATLVAHSWIAQPGSDLFSNRCRRVGGVEPRPSATRRQRAEAKWRGHVAEMVYLPMSQE